MKRQEHKSNRELVEALILRAFIKGFLFGFLIGAGAAGLGLGMAAGVWLLG